jgi:hypothetical protein
MPKSKSFVDEMEEAADAYRKAYKAGLGLDPEKDYVAAAKEKAAELADDLGKGARNYGRAYKEGLGMKPDTPYEKKRGGRIRGYD